MAGFTKKNMEVIVNEARTFGECFLTRRDEGSHNDGWFFVCVC